MAAPTVHKMLRHVRLQNVLNIRPIVTSLFPKRNYCDASGDKDSENVDGLRSESPGDASTEGPKLTGFAQAFAKHAQVGDGELSGESRGTSPLDDHVPFAELFRNSSHVHVGAAHNQVVFGKIFHVVDDDLYIDFGGKFHCVCQRPTENAE